MENCLYTKLMEINKLMRDNGIQTDPKTGKNYFTGYSYKQLYDWDQYFETMVQLYLGWDTGYAKNGIEIFLDYQDDDGFSPRGVGHSNGCVERFWRRSRCSSTGMTGISPFLTALIMKS